MSVYVNIMTNDTIPFLNVKGPLFGYPMSEGIYVLLSKMGIIMELTTPDKAAMRKMEYENSRRSTVVNNTKYDTYKSVEAPKKETVKVEDKKYKTVEELEQMTWTEVREYMDSIEVAYTRGETKKRLINKLIRLKKI